VQDTRLILDVDRPTTLNQVKWIRISEVHIETAYSDSRK
jgi:hypothetical protein